MKRILTLLVSACLLLTLISCSAPEQPEGEASALSFTDSLGNTVTLDTRPQRVAALMGSYAETWLLAGGELCAVTQDAYDERGLELGEEVANLGTNKTPDLEALFAAQPDLVILTPDLEGQLALKDALSAARVPAAWFKVESFDDYLSMLKIFTDLTGRDDLYESNGLAVQEQIDQVLENIPEGEGPSVLLLRAYSTGVKAKNSDNIAGVMLRDLGCRNIADSDSDLLEQLQMEAILATDPEHIFVTTMGSSTGEALESLRELFDSDPAWQSLTAVREDRVHVLDKQLFHYKPNARWGESYEVLANILYPET